MESLHQSFGDGDRRRIAGDVADQNTELVAAQAGHEVLVAEGLGEPRPDGREEPVADVVTERVVDLLEVIEIHQHHREAPVVGGRFLDRLPQLEPEQQAVGEARQMVVERLVLVLALLLARAPRT